jgi:hypothetical protein
VPDERDRRTRFLTNEIEVIMMPESEYLSLSEGGEMEELKQQFKRRKNGKQDKEPRKGPLDNKNRPKTRSIGFDITGECEPTSSKIKVEDLAKNDGNATKGTTRELWDRPVPPPEHRWVGDPRLPNELNIMNAAMWDYNWAHFRPKGGEYRQPDTQEVSKPMEFVARMRDKHQRQTNGPSQKLMLPTIDESMASIDKMKRQYQPPERVVKPQKTLRPLPNKGKAKANGPSEEELANLRQGWHDEFQSILQGVPEELPPLRAVNHEIHLIDPDKRYTYSLPRCPATVRKEFQHKLNRYVNAEWWVPATGTQAPPLLCVPKKDGRLRTVVDARQRNDNTIKDVTPLPDQEVIREDVARAKYRSKVDLADAYEQVRVEPNDVPKTLFATIMGTYYSNVVQQGDCNAPATFQRLMTSIFRDVIGRFMHVYLDDIFVYSDSVEEHQKHLRVVFERLRENHLYLKWKKCELYAKEVECLGHVIDEAGIHPDTDKLDCIRRWRTPRNYNDVQRFVGLVNYVSNFLPNVTTYTGPLMAMTQNGAPFFWRPIHEKCFEMIKAICCKTPVIKPLDYESRKPIWLICDASSTGVGAMYGQGDDWTTCRPAGFMSRKFTTAQQHYAVHEMETLAILEALHKWEDKLIGKKIHVITDHKALEFFKTQSRLSNRQQRWMEYMSKFDFDITYVKGEYNKVADCLSRYYESDTSVDIHDFSNYARADRKLDPDGEDLPKTRIVEIKERIVEIRAMQSIETRRSKRLRDIKEQRDAEAEELQATSEDPQKDIPTHNTENTTLADSLGKTTNGKVQPLRKEDSDEDRRLLNSIRNGYQNDKLFKFVLESPNRYPLFAERGGIIRKTNLQGENVICVPRIRELITKILTDAHEIMGHFGDQRTCEYVRRWYWWPTITKDTRTFCRTCGKCQRAKTPNQKPPGKLHTLPIPNRPWDSIGMDFIGPFPEVNGLNYLWVVICRLTSMTHLIPVHTSVTAKGLSWKYLREIVRLHGLPSTIVSDRDPKFTSKWWRELHRMIGTQLLMSTSFHPQTDGQTERMNRSIGQILRTAVRPDQKDWIEKIDMVEFAINSSVSASTGYAPFELNHGYVPQIMKEFRNVETTSKGIKEFATRALQNIAAAHDAIIEARTFQTFYANQKRGDEPMISKGDLVYLSTKNLNLPKNRARKLCPKYIGPYKVSEAKPDTSTYTLELPKPLQERRIVPTFHISLLKPHHPSDDSAFPNRLQPEPYDFGVTDDHEWFVDEIIGHRWKGKKIEYEVRWSLGDTTWETQANCDQLAALDRYLELRGVDNHAKLPRRN